MLRAAERLRVELVDGLGPRRPGGEPARLGTDLQAAQRLAVARRGGQPADHRLAAHLLDADLIRAEPGPGRLLRAAGPGVHARVGRGSAPGAGLALTFV